jgi:hypothetical protein
MIFFFLRFVVFFAKLIHLHELDFVRIDEWRIDAFAIHELPGVRLNLHTLVIKEEVDESFAGTGPWRFGSQADVLAVAKHVVVSHVIEIGALFVIR